MRNFKGENNPSYKHGFASRGDRHPLYVTWRNMKERCYNIKLEQYKDYGGRGIFVCLEWKDTFINFYNWAISNGWSENLTIDRIKNDDGYTPSNCRFTDRITQGRNQRLKNTNKYGLKGVGFNQGSWRSRITINKKTIFLGRFKTKELAYEARQKYIKDNNITDFFIENEKK